MSLSVFNELIQQGVLPRDTTMSAVPCNKGWQATVVLDGKDYTHSALRKKEAMDLCAAHIIADKNLKKKEASRDARERYFKKGGDIRVEYVHDKDGIKATIFLQAKSGPTQCIGKFNNVYEMNEFVKNFIGENESEWETLPSILGVFR